jgi:hypothetical protein
MVTVHHKTNVSVEELKKRLVEMSKIRVMVGITADDTERKEEGINNASLLYIQTHGARRKSMRDEMQQKMDEGYKYSEAFSMYIHSHGSPLWQIPPRPVLEPAIKDCKDKIATRLTKAFKAAIQGDTAGVIKGFDSAGLYAAKHSIDWFQNPKNHWPPNAPSTLRQKKSTVPLIDTGELMKSIKHTIRRVK